MMIEVRETPEGFDSPFHAKRLSDAKLHLAKMYADRFVTEETTYEYMNEKELKVEHFAHKVDTGPYKLLSINTRFYLPICEAEDV